MTESIPSPSKSNGPASGARMPMPAVMPGSRLSVTRDVIVRVAGAVGVGTGAGFLAQSRWHWCGALFHWLDHARAACPFFARITGDIQRVAFLVAAFTVACAIALTYRWLGFRRIKQEIAQHGRLIRKWRDTDAEVFELSTSRKLDEYAEGRVDFAAYCGAASAERKTLPPTRRT